MSSSAVSTSSRTIDARLIAAGRSARRGLFAAIGLGVGSGLLVIAQAAVIARIVTGIVFLHFSPSSLAADFELLAVLFVLRAALTWASEIAAFHAAASVKRDLRHRLLSHLFRLGPVHAAGERSADLATTITEGVQALEPYLARYLPQMALVALIPLAILAAVFPLDWVSGLILLVTAPVVPLFMVFVGYRAEAITQRQWNKLLVMSAHFLDSIQGITTLKLFGRVRDEVELIARISDDYRRTTMAGLRVAFLTSATLEFFASLSIALVAVLFGVRLLHGHFGFFPAFFVLLLVPEFFSPLRGLATHYHARMGALAAARRIFDILDIEPPRPEGRRQPPRGAVSIACHKLSVAFGDGRPVLCDVDCVFPAGKMTAIVGHCGAGKSTLAAAILGFVSPRTGAVLIDGTVPLATLDREAWWRQLVYVPQSPRIFAGTIAENLRLALPTADDRALREALSRVRLLDDIQALPLGLATRIGEGGGGLSGGQIQRLALARAFLKDAPILILDEATAHLDLETEVQIADAIFDLSRGRTAIVIAHRSRTATRADQIVVLADGHVAETRADGALRAHRGAGAPVLEVAPAPAPKCAP
jgi:ATP-binding cassette subfamily C protein CydD